MILRTLYRTVLAAVSSRARVLGFLGVGALGIVIALVIAGSDGADRLGQAVSMVDGFGLILLIPVSALVFGSASLGDPIEDGTYVYLWLRPSGRWNLSLAAYLATLTLVLPLTLVPTVASGLVIDQSADLVAGALAAGLLAALCYSAVFVALGQFTQRSLVWGISYLLIYEQFIARGGRGLGALSIHAHAASVLEAFVARDVGLAYFAGMTSGVVAVGIVGGFIALSIHRQSTMEVA